MKFPLPYNPARAVHRAVYAAAVTLATTVFYAIAQAVPLSARPDLSLLMFFGVCFVAVYWLETRRVRRRPNRARRAAG